MDIDQSVLVLLLPAFLSGACGGLVLFLFSYRGGHYKNNKILRKFLLEIIGGALTASFVGGTLLSPYVAGFNLWGISFALGISWVGIVEMLRTAITKKVNCRLKEIL